MLQMTGMVVNLYTKEGGTDKEGKPFEPSHKVQIMGAVDLPNGQQQNELIDLKIENLSEWQSLRGKNVAVDVGIYAPAKNSVVYFIKKGSKPRLINGASAQRQLPPLGRGACRFPTTATHAPNGGFSLT